jgi:hypothetical protein
MVPDTPPDDAVASAFFLPPDMQKTNTAHTAITSHNCFFTIIFSLN